MSDDRRETALRTLAGTLGIPALAHVRQRGRDPDVATFTFEFADGRDVRVGTIQTLWSQTEMTKVLAVAIGIPPKPIDRKEWAKLVRVLMTFGVEVEEVVGESFEDTVREWVQAYSRQAITDQNGAAASKGPFIKDDELHVTATKLALYVRREWSEQVQVHALRAALRDLGFERCTINYTTRDDKPSTTSYYRVPTSLLEDIG